MKKIICCLFLFPLLALANESTQKGPLSMTIEAIDELSMQRPELERYLNEDSKQPFQETMQKLNHIRRLFQETPKSFPVMIEEVIDPNTWGEDVLIPKAKSLAMDKCLAAQVYPFCCIQYSPRPQGSIVREEVEYEDTEPAGLFKKKKVTRTKTIKKAHASAVAIGYFDKNDRPYDCQ